jgi:hypothetical protein
MLAHKSKSQAPVRCSAWLDHFVVIAQLFRRDCHSSQASEQNKNTAAIAITVHAQLVKPADRMALRTSTIQIGSSCFLCTASVIAVAVPSDGDVIMPTALEIVSTTITSTIIRHIIDFVLT